jgi:flagellar hook assembly protein FlgD
VLRRVLIAALLGGLAAASPAHAQFKRVLLMPGVTYERQVQFTSHGPVAIHVLTAPRPGGFWSLRPVLSNGAIVGRERVTSMQRTVATQATVAGVNGDLFAWADGRPSGMLMQGGVLTHPPLPDRSSLGITADGTLHVERVRMFGTWRGLGQRRPLALNDPPAPNGQALYTPGWGPTTPASQGTTEAVIEPLPGATPNADLIGPVTQIAQGRGGTPIPSDGAVLVARGTGADKLLAEAPVGTPITFRFRLDPDWTGIVDAIGGGPVLVRDGKPVFRHFELFTTAQLARNPRTGVGQLQDGRIILVVVDGRQPGYSVGMTNFELAQTLVRLGAITGSGLDAGGSSTMAFDGTLLNRPSDPAGEREVSEGLFVFYTGAYAAPPAEPVLSPNGDGVAESQALTYKLVRPSTVNVTLIGPDAVARTLDAGPKAPGVYPFTWQGVTAEGLPEPDGPWRFSVTAVDDQGQTSTAERTFSLNRTLAALSVAPGLLRVRAGGPSLAATFTLARPANVRATVETAAGAVVAVPARLQLAAGTQTIAWNGRVSGNKLAHTGRYRFRVSAVNELGRTELLQPFSVRRVAVAAKKKH